MGEARGVNGVKSTAMCGEGFNGQDSRKSNGYTRQQYVISLIAWLHDRTSTAQYSTHRCVVTTNPPKTKQIELLVRRLVSVRMTVSSIFIPKTRPASVLEYCRNTSNVEKLSRGKRVHRERAQSPTHDYERWGCCIDYEIKFPRHAPEWARKTMIVYESHFVISVPNQKRST